MHQFNGMRDSVLGCTPGMHQINGMRDSVLGCTPACIRSMECVILFYVARPGMHQINEMRDFVYFARPGIHQIICMTLRGKRQL